MVEGLIRACNLLHQVKSFEDDKHLCLMGAGLSPNTYRAWLAAAMPARWAACSSSFLLA